MWVRGSEGGGAKRAVRGCMRHAMWFRDGSEEGWEAGKCGGLSMTAKLLSVSARFTRRRSQLV